MEGETQNKIFVNDRVEKVNSSPKEFSRRELFRRTGTVAKVAAVGLVLNELGESVVDQYDGEIKTEYGTFYPYYEDHNFGINIEDIRDDLDFFFDETGDMPSKQQDQIINSFPGIMLDDHNQPGKFEKLKNSGAKYIFGDVSSPFDYSKVTKPIEVLQFLIGGAATFPWLSNKMNKILDSGEGFYTPPISNRRKFFQGALALSGAWMASPLASGVLGFIPYMNPDKSTTKNVIAGIHGKVTNYHPDNYESYVRNLIWSAKLIDLCKDFYEVNGRMPKIGIHCGFGHAGVFDMLRQGQDKCINKLLSYPNWFLESYINYNGGIDLFSSSWTVDVKSKDYDKDYIDGDMTENKKLDINHKVHSKLKSALEKKLKSGN